MERCCGKSISHNRYIGLDTVSKVLRMRKQITKHKLLFYTVLLLFGAVLYILFIRGIRNPYDSGYQNNQSLEGNNISECEQKLKTQGVGEEITRYEGEPQPVDFTDYPEAKTFYTRITETAQSGPNFDKRFTLAHWGCGTDCVGYALVSVETSKVIAYSPANEDYHLRDFDLDSSFFVLEPVNAGQERKYFEVTETEDGPSTLELACTETAKEDMYRLPG